MATTDAVKVRLDAVTAQAAHAIALRENRSLSNAACTLIKEALAHRRNAALTHAPAYIGAPAPDRP